MVVDAKHGLLRDGWIRVDGERARVIRDTGGWYVVKDRSPWGDARVLFRGAQDMAAIQWSTTILRIAFRAGEGRFRWEEREYDIAAMSEGEIRISQEGRPVARGHVTAAGLHLDSVATEILPILRPLVWVLVLRSETLRVMAA